MGICRVDFSVVILQLLHRVGLEQTWEPTGEARVIFQPEAVGRSALCPVVELSNELGNGPVFSLLLKLLRISKRKRSFLFERIPRRVCFRF